MNTSSADQQKATGVVQEEVRTRLSWRRVLLASLAGSSVGTPILTPSVNSHPFASANSLFDGFFFFLILSLLFVAAITIAVEALFGLVRPHRSWLTLLVAVGLAVAISVPFSPPEMLGYARTKEDVGHWVVIVYALVTALVWWRLLPPRGDQLRNKNA